MCPIEGLYRTNLEKKKGKVSDRRAVSDKPGGEEGKSVRMTVSDKSGEEEGESVR
ncbi:hypothetical protein J7E38_16755 [Bacillus sp. ISL-35]|uniref:hypothetical protein n=1 Tax=Bacillus sp. ISL-35 TaxID=2819122 RepID=UPI001BE9C1A1|nr:hypothetical protein [Bacillus sp. ISL-35]MBT2680662.1 hypothetical protein [Bacillus sp. ISL-35]MBT2702707.1 hypothetical protein [Chryseobacterium sp. ISL-80]